MTDALASRPALLLGSVSPEPRDGRRSRPWSTQAAADGVGSIDARARRAAPDALEPDATLVRAYHRAAAIAAWAVVAIGLTALLGWFAGFPVLTSFRPDWVMMKANTALLTVVSACALLLVQSQRPLAREMSQTCSLAVLALGLLTLAEWLSGRTFGIDQLLVPDATDTSFPGRPSMLTAAGIVACGAALFAVGRGTKRWFVLASILALVVAFNSMIVLLGYVFDAKELYTFAGHFTAVSAPAAASLLLLTGSIIGATVDRSFFRLLASPGSGGIMLRRTLPAAILLPIGIVWLRFIAQRAGLFSTVEFGGSAVAVAMTACGGCGLWWSARLLDGLDRVRLSRDEQIRALNVTLQRRVNALELTNKELEGFSYATSHVLLAPLRAMDGFSQILLDDYSDELDAEGKRLLGIVRSSARETRELIDGMLGYLQLRRQNMAIGPIDMTALVQAVLTGLQSKTRDRKLRIEVAKLPAARGDAAMIQRVWHNLLDNAIKFTAPMAQGVIQVGAAPQEAETIYYVRDNGVGFDMQYAAKLFGVFNRLHGAEFAGDGMGLAIVQRVVARHGGRVWAEGRPGEGATIYFSLPNEGNTDA